MPDLPDDQPLPPMEVEESAGHDGIGSSKIGGPLATQLTGVGDDELLASIIKVTEPGYVPEGVEQRAAISPTLFTANLSRGRLAELEHDPRVVSVELSTRLGRID